MSVVLVATPTIPFAQFRSEHVLVGERDLRGSLNTGLFFSEWTSLKGHVSWVIVIT
jgi:hypothetical protein